MAEVAATGEVAVKDKVYDWLTCQSLVEWLATVTVLVVLIPLSRVPRRSVGEAEPSSTKLNVNQTGMVCFN